MAGISKLGVIAPKLELKKLKPIGKLEPEYWNWNIGNQNIGIYKAET